MEKVKVGLLVGHAPDMQGAVRNGVSEFNFNSKFLEELMENLPEFKAIEVRVFYRPEQRKIGYYKAITTLHKEVDDWGALYDIELHFNGSIHKASGHEVIHSGSEGARNLATIFNDNLTAHLSNRDRGVKLVRQRGSIGLTAGKSYSIIVEPFFGQNLRNYTKGTGGRVALQNAIISSLKELDAIHYDGD